MHRLIPPSGVPIKLTKIIKSLFGLGCGNPKSIILSLTNCKYVYFLNSGRACLSLILNSIYHLSGKQKDVVIIPAYTCYSVAAAIAKCGLKIKLIDIDPNTLDYDYSSLDTLDDNVLAIINSGLFGITGNYAKLQSIQSNEGVFLIDDAAQSFGIKHDGIPAGTFGDAGFYSLGRGKNFSAYSGGILVTNNSRIAAAIESEYESLASTSIIDELIAFSKLVAYSILINPVYYRFLRLIPFLNIGETIFDINFSTAKLTKVQKCIVSDITPDLNKFNQIRRKNSMTLAGELSKYKDILIPGYKEENCFSYLRLPIIFSNTQMRDQVLNKLKIKGIEASKMYPTTIGNIPGIEKYLESGRRSFPGAEKVVNNLLAIPTHPLLQPKDIETILTCFKDVCED